MLVLLTNIEHEDGAMHVFPAGDEAPVVGKRRGLADLFLGRRCGARVLRYNPISTGWGECSAKARRRRGSRRLGEE